MSGLKASRWGPTLLLWHKLGMHRQSSGSEVLQERALAANATPHIAQTSRPESESGVLSWDDHTDSAAGLPFPSARLTQGGAGEQSRLNLDDLQTEASAQKADQGLDP